MYKIQLWQMLAINNVIKGATIFISEKFKESCEWYFKSDVAEFEFHYTNKVKVKTFIDKIRNLTKFSIFFSSSFKPLMTWSIDGRKTWRVWLKDLLLTHILIGHRSLIPFFSVLRLNNHENSDLDVSLWQNYKDQKNRHNFQLRHELSSDVTSHRVTLQMLPSFHLVDWNFEYDMFLTTARFVWCMIILVEKFYNICKVNNTYKGRLIPV